MLGRDSSFEKHLDQLVIEALKGQSSPVLFHYTTEAGLRGILKDRYVRATSHRSTEDEREIVAADGLIRDVVRDLQACRSGLQARTCSSLLRRGYDGDDLKFSKAITVYIACFSPSGHMASQWRKFAGKGTGFCLGFRDSNLVEPPADADVLVASFPVVYDRRVQVRQVARTFEKVLDAQAQFVAKHSCLGLHAQRELADDAERIAVRAMFRMAAMFAMQTKTEDFASEKEWRLLAVINPASEGRVRAEDERGSKPWLPIDLRHPRQLPLMDCVLVGPHAPIGSEDLVRELLHEHGYDRQIPSPRVQRVRLADRYTSTSNGLL